MSSIASFSRRRKGKLPYLRELVRTRWSEGLMWLFWGLTVVYGFGYVFQPLLQNWDKWGGQDWDVHTAYRYITVLSIKHYGELPWYSPYFCHGFPAWAYVEGATNLLSPYLPLYLLAPIGVAVRIEAFLSSLIALLGVFALARRFTRSFALATFAALLFTVNSRWTAQLMAGHTWYFQYGLLPWILFFYDKSCREGSGWHAVVAGAISGLMVTMGGIYPVPHTALALGIYAFALAFTLRSWTPIGRVTVAGIVAIGVAAPKLLPMMELMKRFPRLIDSTEALTLDQFLTLLTSNAHIPVPAWNFHEYGIFIGVGPLVLLVGACVLPSPRNTRVFRVLGILFTLLGLGAFHAYSPWTTLHLIPPFTSQHVPSRFMQVALLMLGIDAAVTFGALLDGALKRFPRIARRYRLIDGVLLVVVLVVCQPMITISREITDATYYRTLPKIERAERFEQTRRIPALDYTPHEIDGAVLPAMMANTGAHECYGVTIAQPGVILRGDTKYRGEAYFSEGSGEAEVTRFSLSSAEVTYSGATPGAVLVYNMNHDPGWSADGEPALDVHNAVGARIEAGGSGKVRFAYRPPGLGAGLVISAVVAGGLVYAWLRRRRRLALESALANIRAHAIPR